MSIESDPDTKPTFVRTDPSEAFLRRWPRSVLVAYLFGLGSVAIIGACKPWIVEAWELTHADKSSASIQACPRSMRHDGVADCIDPKSVRMQTDSRSPTDP